MKQLAFALFLNIVALSFISSMDYDQKLIKAAKKGKVDLVRTLVENLRANSNAQNQDGLTPLHFAADNGHSTVVELLIKLGANINAQNQNGTTPLHFATRNSHSAVVELLIKLGANINAQNQYGNTPLYYALYVGCDQIIECLLSHNATIPADLTDDSTIMETQERQAKLNQVIADHNFQSVVNLLKQGVYYNKQAQVFVNTQRQALFQALGADDIEKVKMLLKQGFSLKTCDKNGNTLLHKAIESGSIKCTKLLITLFYNAQVIDSYLLKKNKVGFTPLDIAITNNQDILRLLLGLRQEPESENSKNTSSN